MLKALFGRIPGAIAPLLTNLDLLRTNFNRVADAQQYGGSMQKEYAARAATTENQLLLLQTKSMRFLPRWGKPPAFTQ